MIVSIIIPVYNIEQYVSCCIESVLVQTFSDIELILIDDGSTDKSSEICDDFARRDNRITVVHKQNEGLSAARNDGIIIARGQYIAFLDGDDYWDDNKALERLVVRAGKSHADIINYSYKKVFEELGNEEEYFHDIPDMPTEYENIKDQAGFMLKYNLYIASACNKLIKRSLLTEDLLFEKDILSEDIDWCARLLDKADSLDFICENFYCYRQRERSITHSVGNKTCIDLADNLIKCFGLRETISDDKRKLFDSYLAYSFGTFFIQQALTKDEQTEEIDKLAPYCWILSKGNDRKVKYLSAGCKIIGFKKMCIIIRKTYGNNRER